MDVIGGNVAFLNIYVQGFTSLTDQFAQALSDLAAHQGLAIFRDPDQVILQVIDGMGGFAVGHAAILTQVHCGVENGLPKGRGFYPIYRQ